MQIEGVNWTFEGLVTDVKTTFDLPNVQFEWIEGDPVQNKALKDNQLYVPLYLNYERQNLITPVKIDIIG